MVAFSLGIALTTSKMIIKTACFRIKSFDIIMASGNEVMTILVSHSGWCVVRRRGLSVPTTQQGTPGAQRLGYCQSEH